MANQQSDNLNREDWETIKSIYRNIDFLSSESYQVDELIRENKRLKKLAHDLQKEIEFMVFESHETHELEEK